MRKKLRLALILCFAGAQAFAQNGQEVIAGKAGMYPSYISFPAGTQPDFVPGTVLLQQQDAFVLSKATILLHSEPDQLGQVHYRYQQKINDIRVEGAVYIMHVASGKVTSLNGEWIETTPADLTSEPALNESIALQKAMSDLQ